MSEQPLKNLSRREKEVVSLLANGYSFKMAARLLSLSPRTVEIHALNARKKFGSRNITELAVRAVVGGHIEI